MIFSSISLLAQQKNDSTEKWSYHFQLTAINQIHPSFKAAYAGLNSLDNNAEKKALSLTTTLYAGRQLWKNASIYANAEIAGGAGISSARGIAGFPNGETFRIGDASPALYMARLFLRQHIALGNTEYQYVAGDVNQLAGKIPTSRLTLTAGIFSLADFFDGNKYSHDPRTQFMNWSLMSNGAWDYPANTRGYTKGIVLEFIKPGWALRVATTLVPKKANGLKMDDQITKAHSETIEIEKNWSLKRPGAIRLLAFHTISQAPNYAATLVETDRGDSSSVAVYTGQTEWKRYGGIKYGVGINAEQELFDDAGVFFKASWNDGKTATWAFTEIDQSISLGLNLKGNKWKRPSDNVGIAQVVNGISTAHQRFLNAGLYGFIIGDGKLNYGAEAITEIFYQVKITPTLYTTFNYQYVQNPAYNKDRGPVHVFAIRCHLAF